MATIEPKRETIIKESFVLTYERSELEAIVENPKPWLREIKAVLDRSNQQPLKRAIAPAVKPTNKVQKKKNRRRSPRKLSLSQLGNINAGIAPGDLRPRVGATSMRRKSTEQTSATSRLAVTRLSETTLACRDRRTR